MGALHKPTDEMRAQVFALSSFGVKQDDIGGFLGITDDTLRKHYAAELDRAAIDRNAEVAAFLFRSANGSTISEGASYSDCLKAAMFWLKTRAQWRETSVIEGPGENGEHLVQNTVSDELRTALDAIAGKIASGDKPG